MKVQLKDLKPNPFKKEINKGKLNELKIEQLQESIEKDGFWDNVICRKSNGQYELAYGHHRIEAAKRHFGNDFEVDIPCKKLDDEAMLRILGNENNTTNEEYTVYQIDQVMLTKKFLEQHLEIIKKICPSGGHITKPFQIDSSRTISKFLGEKNWSKSKVANLLKLEENLHPKILKETRNVANKGTDYEGISKTHATFIATLPKEKQLNAYNIVKKHDLSKRQTKQVVKDLKNDIKATVPREEKELPTIGEVIVKFIKRITELRGELKAFTAHKENLKKGTKLMLESSLKEFEKIMDKYFEKEI